VTELLTTALLLLPLRALAIAGLWRAAYFPLLPSPDPRGWPRRFPLIAVDRVHAGVLWPLRYLAERYLPHQLQQPLITCAACMATVYGPLPYFLLLGTGTQALLLYLIYWPALSAAGITVATYVNPDR